MSRATDHQQNVGRAAGPRPPAGGHGFSLSVVFVRSPARATSPRWTALRRKRRAVWRGHARNRLIVQIALACRAGDAARLRGAGLPVGPEELPTRRRGARVTVLVESTEQGRELLALLPGWDMLDAVPGAGEEGCEPDADVAPVPAGRVVTLVYAARHGLAADVVVRATGGRGKIHLDYEARPKGKKQLAPLVIDLADDFDARAADDTLARLREYRGQGWRVTGPVTP